MTAAAVLRTITKCVSIAVLTAAISMSAYTANASQSLQTLVDDIWQYELASFPTLASRQGIKDFDDRLTDISPAGLADRAEQFQRYLDQLNAIDQSGLNQDQLTTLLMQQYRIQNYKGFSDIPYCVII